AALRDLHSFPTRRSSDLNSRQIHIARNNREVADLTFKLQVETTVAAIMSLYWQFVALNEQVRVAQEAVAAPQRLYEDNKRQVERSEEHTSELQSPYDLVC